MSFDDDVDEARRRLEAARVGVGESPPDELEMLNRALAALREKIQSRRLAFVLSDAENDRFIDVLHAETDESLGAAYVEDGEFVFESAHDEYFDDLVDEDLASFVMRLYETLRADLPKYEVELEDE